MDLFQIYYLMAFLMASLSSSKATDSWVDSSRFLTWHWPEASSLSPMITAQRYPLRSAYLNWPFYRFAKEYTLPGENVNDYSKIIARHSAAKAGVRGECCKFATLSGNQGKMEPFEKNSSEKRLDFSSSSAIIGSEGDLYRLNNYF